MTEKNIKAVTQGVTDAWDFWLSQHDVSVPDRIEAAVGDAFKAWLDQHTAELIAAIAEAAAHEAKGKTE
jgi:hypothetical protein